jgi:glycosyltransferase involved in cell wall biosynthesis
MTPWLLVAGDFTPLGGMDTANHALARYLAARGEVHLVTHRAWPDLTARASVTVHRALRPFGRHALGTALLSLSGRRVWRRLRSRGVHVVVNGGNCDVPGANWVHYLHAAYAPTIAGSAGRRAKRTLIYRCDLADERRAHRAALVVICNSHRTRADVIERIGIAESRVHVVYYGSDPGRLTPVQASERSAAKAALSPDADRPLVGFVGALGDRRKAFDTVFSAWTILCRRADWDADLVVVGSGAELSSWRERAAREGLRDRIRFTGFRDDVPELMAAFDAVVHPARDRKSVV